MIKKTIPSGKVNNAAAAKQPSNTLLNNPEWNKWQKAPKQAQGNLGMGFFAAATPTAGDNKQEQVNEDDVSMDEEIKKPASKVLKK